MRRLSIPAVIMLLAGVLLSSGTASASRHKVDVCHHTGDGGHPLVNISHNAVDAHLRHGDALPGDPVPDMPGYEFADDCTIQQIDSDGDGFGVLDDCDDTDAGVNPDAPEIADDGVDQNCNGADLVTWYSDVDGDGFGDPNSPVLDESGAQPAGAVADASDCDDTDPGVNPAAEEVGDGIDNDCDGQVDEGLAPDYLAVAYINYSGSPGFDPSAGDVLIAAIEDTTGDGSPTPGDLVVTSSYPIDLVPSGFAEFQQRQHTVLQVLFADASGVRVFTAEGAFFAFFARSSAGVCEAYQESNAVATSVIADNCDVDGIQVSTGSPSLPSIPVLSGPQLDGQDDLFIDVAVFLP